MKTISLIFLLFMLNLLFSQIDFDLDFSFEKIHPNDELKNIQIVDYNNDGENEVIAFYSHDFEQVWNILCYDLSGEILFTQQILFEDEHEIRFTYYQKNNLEKYLISSSMIEYEMGIVKIYDFATVSLIDSLGYLCEGELYPKYIQPTLYNNDILIYAGNFIFLPGGNYSEVYKFLFSNNSLSFIESIDDCGWQCCYFDYYSDLIMLGYNYSEGGYDNFYQDIYLNQITNEIYSSVYQFLHLGGSAYFDQFETIYHDWIFILNIISKNDSLINEYGMIISYIIWDIDDGNYVVFKCFEPDFSGVIWVRFDSQIGMGSITASTCVSTNEGDHFVLYFRENLFEVRNRITGDIKLSGESSIDPFEILRKSDGELLFFEESGDSYNVYRIAEEIQVSVDENQVTDTPIQLYNFPNPFQSETKIFFSSAENTENAEINIYNAKGQKVKEFRNIGNDSSVVWNAENFPTGIYLYQVRIGNDKSKVRKMILID